MGLILHDSRPLLYGEPQPVSKRLPIPDVSWAAPHTNSSGYWDLGRRGYRPFVGNTLTYARTPVGVGLYTPTSTELRWTLPSFDIDTDAYVGHCAFFIESLGTSTVSWRFRFAENSTSRIVIEVNKDGAQYSDRAGSAGYSTAGLNVGGVNSAAVYVTDAVQQLWLNGKRWTDLANSSGWVAVTEGYLAQTYGSGTEPVVYALQYASWKGQGQQFAEWLSQDYRNLYEPKRIWVPVSSGASGFQAAWALNRSRIIGVGVR